MKVLYWSKGSRLYFVTVEDHEVSLFRRGYLVDQGFQGYVQANTI